MDKVDKTIVIISIILGIIGIMDFSMFFFIVMGVYLNASSVEEILNVRVKVTPLIIITSTLGLAIFLFALIYGIISLRRDRLMRIAYFLLFISIVVECGLSLLQTIIYGFDWQIKELFSSESLLNLSTTLMGSLFDAFVVGCLLLGVVFFVYKYREKKG